MNVILKYRGREVTDGEVVFIRELIARHPTLSRRRLSEELCRAWNWVQPNGNPKDMVCPAPPLPSGPLLASSSKISI